MALYFSSVGLDEALFGPGLSKLQRQRMPVDTPIAPGPTAAAAVLVDDDRGRNSFIFACRFTCVACLRKAVAMYRARRPRTRVGAWFLRVSDDQREVDVVDGRETSPQNLALLVARRRA